MSETASTLQGALKGIRSILVCCGERPEREGLKETPARFLKAMREMTSGYKEDPKDHLKKDFDIRDADANVVYDSIIMSDPLDFVSVCEHHMLTFHGVAYIGYLPGVHGRVVGLSKIARLLDGYAKRFQVQERLTQQIANAMQEVLNPIGVGVVIKAQHSCQCFRGVRKAGFMKTAVMKGVFRDEHSARQEFYDLMKL